MPEGIFCRSCGEKLASLSAGTPSEQRITELDAAHRPHCTPQTGTPRPRTRDEWRRLDEANIAAARAHAPDRSLDPAGAERHDHFLNALDRLHGAANERERRAAQWAEEEEARKAARRRRADEKKWLAARRERDGLPPIGKPPAKKKTAAKKPAPAPAATTSAHKGCKACGGTGVLAEHSSDGKFAGSVPCDGRPRRTAAPAPAKKAAAKAAPSKTAAKKPAPAPAPAGKKAPRKVVAKAAKAGSTGAAARPPARTPAPKPKSIDTKGAVAEAHAAVREAKAAAGPTPRKRTASAAAVRAARPPRTSTTSATPAQPKTAGAQQVVPPSRPAPRKAVAQQQARKKTEQRAAARTARPGVGAAGMTRAKKIARTTRWVRSNPGTAALAVAITASTASWRGLSASGRGLRSAAETAAVARADRRASAKAAAATTSAHKGCKACGGTGVLATHSSDGKFAGSIPCDRRTKSPSSTTSARRAKRRRTA